jgi:hypothetical protein
VEATTLQSLKLPNPIHDTAAYRSPIVFVIRLVHHVFQSLASGDIFLFSFLRKGAHERLRAGCNGGNSWNCFERKIFDFTGMTSRFAANGTDQRDQQKEGRKDCRFAVLTGN